MCKPERLWCSKVEVLKVSHSWTNCCQFFAVDVFVPNLISIVSIESIESRA